MELVVLRSRTAYFYTQKGGTVIAQFVSPLAWTGNKSCIYYTIEAFMPPHRVYIEPCMGSAEVFFRKKPAEKEMLNDYNGDLVNFFRILQDGDKLAFLLGRLCLSWSSEYVFQRNRSILAAEPNVLDEALTTAKIIRKASWRDDSLFGGLEEIRLHFCPLRGMGQKLR